ncbi:MAG: hypothetical protein E7491_01120 [Ruminococcaceae bacterium]|nr:hypothetical protein [Oscillospiraceae bacterium]
MKKAVIIISVCLVFLFSVVLLAIVNRPAVTLDSNLLNAPFAEGEISMSLKGWTVPEERKYGYVSCLEKSETYIDVSCTYTVDDDGTLYFYDTYNSLIKIFQDGKQTSQIDMRQIFPEYFDEFETCDLLYICVSEGHIFATEYSNSLVLKISEAGTEKININKENVRFMELRKTIDGKVLLDITDNDYNYNGFYCLYDPSGELEQSVLYAPNKTNYHKIDTREGYYPEIYRNPNGQTIKYTSPDYCLHEIYVLNEKNWLTNKIKFNSKEELRDSGYMGSISALHLDADINGNIYFRINAYEDDYDRTFLVKINITDNTLENIEIPHVGSASDDSYSDSLSESVCLNGDIFIPYVNSEGIEIRKFSFD